MHTLRTGSSALTGGASPSSDGQSGSGLRAKSNSPPWPLRPHFLCSLLSPRGTCRRDHCKNRSTSPGGDGAPRLASSSICLPASLPGISNWEELGVRGSPAPRPALTAAFKDILPAPVQAKLWLLFQAAVPSSLV